MTMIYKDWLDQIIKNALNEDLGSGLDLTTSSILGSQDIFGKAIMITKESGVLAGSFVVERVFKNISCEIECKELIKDGQNVAYGEPVMEISGPLAQILMGERLALNFYQRLSGIATKTNELVELISNYSCDILDTRKTTPGIRPLEKYAVRMGGGLNHRMGLNDAVIIKDNHKKVAGSITEALKRVKTNVGPMVKVSVETTNLQEAKEAYQNGADIILLDNMTIEDLTKCVRLLSNKVLLEASGNITKDNIIDVASTGVDFISIGSITHSATSLDLSLNF
ncbi:carboxylating nicotinate-nucleotide diphosphorylase [Natranaerobius trueperi]|uniref:Probable nicotinate-nucleotide pyrophosphorylase [carboxylating] n=1 Tax=Natranaerobius trueperi TaxID=759412 RepID=A0A226C1Q6_9FIRM|nr:carboxylating nicotinate-nucleotide diphosphorylase [Natranaerobius trueperi]OWZ84369.1 nicotinate-nucleotide diphosphorylase (carboxylating) [Natranaerobius trueperi]